MKPLGWRGGWGDHGKHCILKKVIGRSLSLRDTLDRAMKRSEKNNAKKEMRGE